ncbi:myeloid leukemia factor isoform X3 [Anastrepha obliqua]|uniref:myeloid leukemia factor isoform X3 n=1 Tax=Anastrepha obliqua TaxID=95512 RepID=UPI00240A2BD7|nr:myeloid leukemia factor isoform X3 [Anastrepha obliqua]
MSLFGSLMGDFDDDLFMGNHMNAMNMQMRSMNRLMNSLMPDPFNMLTPFDSGFQQNALMERGNPHVGNPMGGFMGFPPMANINRLLNSDIGQPHGSSYCSSSVITMSSGPDGRPQIYQATSSTKTGPGGIRETRKTVEDSRQGMKKMAIGHHIGERSHIIEKEQDLRSGQLEERQEFINLEEDEAEDFDREFTNRARMGGVRGARPQEMITIESADDDDARPRHYSRHHGSGGQHRRHLPALPAPPQQNSVHPHPYNASAARRNYRSKHTKQHQQPHQPQTLTITEIIDDDDEDEPQPTTATVTVVEEDDDAAEATTVINPAAQAAKTPANKSHTSAH